MSTVDQNSLIQCTDCSAKLKLKNLVRHLENVHHLDHAAARKARNKVIRATEAQEREHDDRVERLYRYRARRMDIIFIVVLVAAILSGLGLYFYLSLPEEGATTGPSGWRYYTAGPVEEIEFATNDGFALKGTLHKTTRENAPGIILVHGLNERRSVWSTLATELQKRGNHVLSFDLRGHGESTLQNGLTYTLAEFKESDFTNMSRDLEAAEKYLKGNTATSGKLGIIGASIGANLALTVAAGEPSISTVILLSPGLDYRGVTTTAELDQYGARPIFFAVGTGDQYAASSTTTLYDSATGDKELKRVDGTDHGTNLLKHAVVKSGILDWLHRKMG